jgi:hypothetical protein
MGEFLVAPLSSFRFSITLTNIHKATCINVLQFLKILIR